MQGPPESQLHPITAWLFHCNFQCNTTQSLRETFLSPWQVLHTRGCQEQGKECWCHLDLNLGESRQIYQFSSQGPAPAWTRNVLQQQQPGSAPALFLVTGLDGLQLFLFDASPEMLLV